jgi:hypothetical protein
MHQFVYVHYGSSDDINLQLQYSLRTLLAEIGGAAERISIFTDQPSLFARTDFDVVDIGPHLRAMTRDFSYLHRAKPIVLGQALRRHHKACVLLDADSFIRTGFDREVAQTLAGGAAMNLFERTNPFPSLDPFTINLPQCGAYSYDPVKSIMFNSGLVAVNPEHVHIMDEAIMLIDALLERGHQFHDIEQFAITELLRLSNVDIAEIHDTFVHYCKRSVKRYMSWQLRRTLDNSFDALLPARPSIPFNKARFLIFKHRQQFNSSFKLGG